jgi:hypothetical protein
MNVYPSLSAQRALRINVNVMFVFFFGTFHTYSLKSHNQQNLWNWLVINLYVYDLLDKIDHKYLLYTGGERTFSPGW